MNSFEMLLWLEALTGIEGLIPDPYFGGGGLHQIEPGGFLKIHADFNVHPKLKLDRRLNMLIYLNKDWRDEYGGHLELWDRDMTRVPQEDPAALQPHGDFLDDRHVVSRPSASADVAPGG